MFGAQKLARLPWRPFEKAPGIGGRQPKRAERESHF